MVSISHIGRLVDAVLEAQGVSEIRWHESKDRTGADVVRLKILEALLQLSH